MKIHVNSDRKNIHAAYWIVNELKKKGMYIEDPEADIVWNIDSIHNIGFLKGRFVTIHWEVDDYMMLGRNGAWYDQADLLYIVHPEYKRYYPEKARVLRVAADPDFHKERSEVLKQWDYVFVGTIEPLPVYLHRIQILDSVLRSHPSSMITYGSLETYPHLMSMGKVILDVLPMTKNGIVCMHCHLYEAMATGCLMVDYHPYMDGIAQKDTHFITYDRLGKITDKEINKIKKASREHIINNHTWSHRVDQVVKDINEIL